MQKKAFSNSGLLLFKFLLAFAALAGVPSFAQEGDDLKIVNYIAYSDSLASSGQPSGDALEVISKAGVERIVYLAFGDHDTSLPGEDRIVRDLGMQFVHIPVIWEAPTVADYEIFSAVMQQAEGANTLVHCQVNWRASSFVFLYRVIAQGVSMNDAVLALNSIWTPSAQWREFIVTVLNAYNLDLDCEFCGALQG